MMLVCGNQRILMAGASMVVVVAVALCSLTTVTAAWTIQPLPLLSPLGTKTKVASVTRLISINNHNYQRSLVVTAQASSLASSNDDWTNVPEPPANNNNDNSSSRKERKLGIDIGAMLDPLSEQEAADLKLAATEIINDTVASGLDDLSRLRRTMQQDLEAQRLASLQQSQRNAQQAEAQLLSKIDALTNDFLSSTASSRRATQWAASADQASSGQGVELGAWGTTASGAAVPLMGSVDSRSSSANAATITTTTATTEKEPQTNNNYNRIAVLADTAADPYAKQLLEPLTAALQSLLGPNQELQVKVYKPTATVPLGGDNAAAILLFCTSFTDPSSVRNALDRLLRQTLPTTTATGGSSGGHPPTQIVAISTIGTERVEKMPYTLQNLMGNGKLDKRRQMEEAVVAAVTTRRTSSAASMDYAIVKLGELQNDCRGDFVLRAGDSLDGSLDLATAVTVLAQATAVQPFARNVTFSCVGKLALPDNSDQQQKFLDEAFLRLDGPELWRTEGAEVSSNVPRDYDPLVEYTREWAQLLAETGKGLTTPVRAESVVNKNSMPPGVKRQEAVKLLFLPTSTGKYYRSKDEERETETTDVAAANRQNNPKSMKEGGLEFVVEVTETDALRVRVKRCNYGDDVIVKELSEETILSNFRKSIDVWTKDHQKRKQQRPAYGEYLQ